jgi:hypothetical protein
MSPIHPFVSILIDGLGDLQPEDEASTQGDHDSVGTSAEE